MQLILVFYYRILAQFAGMNNQIRFSIKALKLADLALNHESGQSLSIKMKLLSRNIINVEII